MRVVILAGGLGTRLREETEIRPKPMVEIGGRPILWHIMKHYAHHGFNEFVVALGYKGEVIKRFFSEYHALSGSMTIQLATGKIEVRDGRREDWTVHLVDTGLQTPTGSRVKRLESWLQGGPFMVTYGDGVSDVDLGALLRFHRSHGKLVTLTAVRPPARFGGIVFDDDAAARFTEKPQAGEGWINGGFLVCEPGVLDYLQPDGTSLEKDAIEAIAAKGQLAAYRHHGFWQCMDVLRDAQYLEGLWQSGQAPWKVWER
ncbi:MAG TPA: glucose-1-phosphate cytidylyltransferase [Terriglobales bacterium]|nr:glucose-1-phosphate cytidylyltransferase [Terriglobales bacterium]